MTTNNDSGSTAARHTSTTDPYLVVDAPPATGSAGSTGGGQSAGDKGRQVSGAAKEQAQEVAGTAKDQASAVAGSAQAQAQNVLAEAKDQAGDLFEDLRRQLAEQSDTVRDRLSEFLSGVGSELGDMASAGGGSGYATQVVRQVGDRASTWGSTMRDQGSGDLLQQTRSFARRKPGTFLLGALAAGVLAGRLSRGAKAQHDEQKDTAALTGTPSPSVRTTPVPATPVSTDPLPPTGTLGGLESSGVRPTQPYGTGTAADEFGEYRR